jgi:hypothetical protein
MPMTRPTSSGTVEAFAAPAGAHLTYFGGPIIGSVKVVTVFWNSSVNFQSNLNSFYGAVTNSPYYDLLSQYSITGTQLQRGGFLASFVDNQSNSSVTDAQVQAHLTQLINTGKVPANSPNNYYAFHFPPGVNITGSDGSNSCQVSNGVFCAYHGTYTLNGQNVYYGIIPDLGSGSCTAGCGGSTVVNNTTSVSSHELVEATTDPAVGLATTVGPPLAWYDQTNGEIGDICNAQQGTAAGFVVQKEWSNADGACVDHSGTTCTPTCTGKQCGSDGCGGSCGTCPSGQTCNANGQCTTTCTPNCTGKSCGSDGCGGSCGTCPSGQTCDANGQCTTTCTPQCTGKTCGDDGCGGSCGTCPSGQTCGPNGTCQGNTTCSHPLCSTGTKLTSTCDPCAGKICAQDSYCCNTLWDSICVGEVTSICGQSCGTGGNCAHPICSTGAKLKKSCDPCATKICNADPYCCSTQWDSICVSEVSSVCGQTCN